MNIFYEKTITEGLNELSEEESKHCSLVLRHQVGDEIIVVDGNGGKYRSVLKSVGKKKCEFETIKVKFEPRKAFYVHLGISPTKNADRIEWMIEKLSEIGIDEITFLQTRHSERKKQRLDRLEKKAISAMKQSGTSYKLIINEMTTLDDFMQSDHADQKFIAHVDQDHYPLKGLITPKKKLSILIGPEGDFSNEEVAEAIGIGYQPVSLGLTTLRTETAGLIACCTANFVNDY